MAAVARTRSRRFTVLFVVGLALLIAGGVAALFDLGQTFSGAMPVLPDSAYDGTAPAAPVTPDLWIFAFIAVAVAGLVVLAVAIALRPSAADRGAR